MSDSCTRQLSSIDKALLTPFTSPLQYGYDRWVSVAFAWYRDPWDLQQTDVCGECKNDIQWEWQPYYSLAHGCWVGDMPKELGALTFAEELLIGLAKTSVQIVKLFFKTVHSGDPQSLQCALKGTCLTYWQNIPEVVQMLKDKLLPHPPTIFSLTLSVAFIRSQKISRENLRSLFTVCWKRVYTALLWLKDHNDLYAGIRVSVETLWQLPENNVQ